MTLRHEVQCGKNTGHGDRGDLLAKGGVRGNVGLRRALGWDEPIYTATKDDLIASGSIMPGRGRGGSVTLPS